MYEFNGGADLKKFFVSIIVIMFLTAVSLFSLNAKAAQSSDIRVGLYYASTAPSSVTISGNGLQYGSLTNTFVLEEDLSSNGITLSLTEEFTFTDGTRTYGAPQSEIAIATSDGQISIEGKKYRGYVVLKPQSDGKITVINSLSVDEYLYGVIGSEMPSSWNIEALKAQAVCARCFALTNMNKHVGYGFNVCSTTNCQVYGGIASETESTRRAVDETAGKILKYNGQIAQTVFFSCSGGHTADVRNIWGGDFPYLYGVDDPYENEDNTPRHSWVATLTNDDIKASLNKIGVDVGDIVSVETAIDASQHVYELTVTGTNGKHTLKKQDTCSVFASYGLMSTKYTVAPYGSNASSVYAISSTGTSLSSPAFALSSSVKTAMENGFSVLSSSGKSAVSSGGAKGYIFNGGGWGHGVGMSQYGANAMAANGFKYDDILYHYYPGTNLE